MSTPNRIKTLYLSFGAVLYKLRFVSVTMAEFDDALIFCTSEQVALSDHIYRHDMAREVLAKAGREGRLLFEKSPMDIENEESGIKTTFAQIDEFLQRHGVEGSIGNDGQIDHIPMRSGVPSVPGIEVHWAETPTQLPAKGYSAEAHAANLEVRRQKLQHVIDRYEGRQTPSQPPQSRPPQATQPAGDVEEEERREPWQEDPNAWEQGTPSLADESPESNDSGEEDDDEDIPDPDAWMRKI